MLILVLMCFSSRSNGDILFIPWVVTARFGYQRGHFFHIVLCDMVNSGHFVTVPKIESPNHVNTAWVKLKNLVTIVTYLDQLSNAILR